MKSFSVCSLSAGYGRNEIIHSAEADIPVGKITALTGSNACGKTTLLKCMANIIKPFSGECRIDQVPFASIKSRVLARRIAFCAQDHPDCSYLTVRELVKMGRYPYGNESSHSANNAVDEAMHLADVTAYSSCRIGELSAGTVQRVWLALALAQQPELLLLDEPTNFLDPLKKQQLIKTLKYLRDERTVTVVVVTHDLETVSSAADNVIALKEGRVICSGAPGDVLTPDSLSQIYGVQ